MSAENREIPDSGEGSFTEAQKVASREFDRLRNEAKHQEAGLDADTPIDWDIASNEAAFIRRFLMQAKTTDRLAGMAYGQINFIDMLNKRPEPPFPRAVAEALKAMIRTYVHSVFTGLGVDLTAHYPKTLNLKGEGRSS